MDPEKRTIDLGDGTTAETVRKEFKSDEQLERASQFLDKLDYIIRNAKYYNEKQVEDATRFKEEIEADPSNLTGRAEQEINEIYEDEELDLSSDLEPEKKEKQDPVLARMLGDAEMQLKNYQDFKNREEKWNPNNERHLQALKKRLELAKKGDFLSDFDIDGVKQESIREHYAGYAQLRKRNCEREIKDALEEFEKKDYETADRLCDSALWNLENYKLYTEYLGYIDKKDNKEENEWIKETEKKIRQIIEDCKKAQVDRGVQEALDFLKNLEESEKNRQEKEHNPAKESVDKLEDISKEEIKNLEQPVLEHALEQDLLNIDDVESKPGKSEVEENTLKEVIESMAKAGKASPKMKELLKKFKQITNRDLEAEVLEGVEYKKPKESRQDYEDRRNEKAREIVKEAVMDEWIKKALHKLEVLNKNKHPGKKIKITEKALLKHFDNIDVILFGKKAVDGGRKLTNETKEILKKYLESKVNPFSVDLNVEAEDMPESSKGTNNEAADTSTEVKSEKASEIVELDRDIRNSIILELDQFIDELIDEIKQNPDIKLKNARKIIDLKNLVKEINSEEKLPKEFAALALGFISKNSMLQTELAQKITGRELDYEIRNIMVQDGLEYDIDKYVEKNLELEKKEVLDQEVNIALNQALKYHKEYSSLNDIKIALKNGSKDGFKFSPEMYLALINCKQGYDPLSARYGWWDGIKMNTYENVQGENAPDTKWSSMEEFVSFLDNTKKMYLDWIEEEAKENLRRNWGRKYNVTKQKIIMNIVSRLAPNKNNVFIKISQIVKARKQKTAA